MPTYMSVTNIPSKTLLLLIWGLKGLHFRALFLNNVSKCHIAELFSGWGVL